MIARCHQWMLRSGANRGVSVVSGGNGTAGLNGVGFNEFMDLILFSCILLLGGGGFSRLYLYITLSG